MGQNLDSTDEQAFCYHIGNLSRPSALVLILTHGRQFFLLSLCYKLTAPMQLGNCLIGSSRVSDGKNHLAGCADWILPPQSLIFEQSETKSTGQFGTPASRSSTESTEQRCCTSRQTSLSKMPRSTSAGTSHTGFTAGAACELRCCGPKLPMISKTQQQQPSRRPSWIASP